MGASATFGQLRGKRQTMATWIAFPTKGVIEHDNEKELQHEKTRQVPGTE